MSDVNLLLKALAAIEGYALLKHSEELGMVYMIAHNALGHCASCKDTKIIDRIYDEMEKEGFAISYSELLEIPISQNW